MHTTNKEPNNVQTLLSSENKKSVALTSLALKSSSSSSSTTNVEKAKLAWKMPSYFSQLFGSKHSAINDTGMLQKDKKRSNMLKIVESAIDRHDEQESATMLCDDNPLQLKWNTCDSKNDNFNPQIAVTLDPLTEPTQRIVSMMYVGANIVVLTEMQIVRIGNLRLATSIERIVKSFVSFHQRALVDQASIYRLPMHAFCMIVIGIHKN